MCKCKHKNALKGGFSNNTGGRCYYFFRVLRKQQVDFTFTSVDKNNNFGVGLRLF